MIRIKPATSSYTSSSSSDDNWTKLRIRYDGDFSEGQTITLEYQFEGEPVKVCRRKVMYNRRHGLHIDFRYHAIYFEDFNDADENGWAEIDWKK